MLPTVGWVIFVAEIGMLVLAILHEKITEPWVWMLWGVFIGGIGVAGGLFILAGTK